MIKMGGVMHNLSYGLQLYRREFELYRDQFGSRPLTERERKKIHRLKEQIAALPD
jgi:hypothetical protein